MKEILNPCTESALDVVPDPKRQDPEAPEYVSALHRFRVYEYKRV